MFIFFMFRRLRFLFFPALAILIAAIVAVREGSPALVNASGEPTVAQIQTFLRANTTPAEAKQALKNFHYKDIYKGSHEFLVFPAFKLVFIDHQFSKLVVFKPSPNA